MLCDRDPGEATFAEDVRISRELHIVLKADGVPAFVKTSGKAGLHVLVAWTQAGGFDEARAWALEVAGRGIHALPEVATLERGKAQRGRRVYVDVMQNARGKHWVPPFTLRAVPGLTVSTPLNWRELTAGFYPARFTLKTLFNRLARQKQGPLTGLLESMRPGGQAEASRSSNPTTALIPGWRG